MNLNGKRVLITRPRAQADGLAEALLAESAHPIFFPVIEIIPPDDYSGLDSAIQNMNSYNWLILTSVHGVDAFFTRLRVLGVERIPDSLHVAAVGLRTAECVSQRGIVPDHVPDKYVAEAMLTGLSGGVAGKRFLLPQSDLARDVLAEAIRNAGGFVDEVVAYRTVPAQPDSLAMDTLRSGVDVVTFTSPSTVRNFIAIVQQNGLDPFRLAGNPIFTCIGPVTKEAAEQAGFVNLIMAGKYTTTGLVEALATSHFKNTSSLVIASGAASATKQSYEK